jgi:hypothetical protein
VSRRATAGVHGRLRVVDSDMSPRRDSVARLHRFQGNYPEVQFTSSTMGPYSQYTALIPPETIPGENREIIIKSPDLCGLMDQLDDLFTTPAKSD